MDIGKGKLLLVAILLIIASTGIGTAIPSISVVPSSNIVNSGDNFTVDIRVDPDTTSMYSVQVLLAFNPAMLQIRQKPTVGPFLTQDGASSLVIVNKFNNTVGTWEYGETRMDTTTGVNTPGILASMSFHVNDGAAAGTSSALNLSDVILLEIIDGSTFPIDNVNINNGSAYIPCNASVTITKPTEGAVIPSTTVNVNYAKSGCLNNVDHAILQLDSGSEVTDNDGDYTFTGVPVGSHVIKAWLADSSNNKLPGAFDDVNFAVALRTPIINVTPRTQTAYVGDTVTVDITVNPDTLEVFGAQFNLNYISSILNATSITRGSFLTQDGASSIVIKSICDNAASQCNYGESRNGVTNGVTTPGTLATITFRADAAGTVPLDLSNVILTDPSPAEISGLILNNGSVTVLPPRPAYVSIVNPTEGQNVFGETINVKYSESGFLGKVNHSDLQLDSGAVVHDTDNDGNYAFSGVSYGSHKIQVWLVDSSENKVFDAYDIVNFTNSAPIHAPKINVTPAYSSVRPGDTIRINITLNPDTIESYAASVKLSFNNSMLEVLNLYEGNVLKQDGAATLVGTKTFNNVLGTVEYAESRAGTDTGVLNEGTLFQILFRVKPVSRGSIGEIDLTSGIVLDPDLNTIAGVTLNDGIVEYPLNQAPVAIAKTNHSENNVGYNVFLDGSDSSDPDGYLDAYEWDFDDGTAHVFGPKVKHVYGNHKWNGTAYESYNVKLWVKDNEGAVSQTSISITPWIAGDTNGDGNVDIIDLARMGKSWNTLSGDTKYSDGTDINNDNVVNILDLVILGLNWGNTA